MWQQPETSWTVFVSGYLSPGDLHFNSEVRPQGTDLWIHWENCVPPFEKRHGSTWTDLEGAEISNTTQPEVLSIGPLKNDQTSLENTLKWPELVVISQHSPRASILMHSLCYCPHMIEDCLYYLRELDVYSNGLLCVCV